VMGISAFAPPLDEAGNSVKGQAAVKAVMNKLGIGIFTGNQVVVTD
ncbi:MAG: glutaminase, partial [Muribaculaceae bacterium]|nr:glutaminase [Muribaculaceae bacterium]